MKSDQAGAKFSGWGRLIKHLRSWRPSRAYLLVGFVVAVVVLLWYDYQRTQVPFVIVFSGQPYAEWTHQDTVGSALLDVGLEVGTGDVVTPGLAASLRHGEVITVERAVPVFIEADGRLFDWHTHKRTPVEIFAEVGVRLREHDEVLVSGQQRPRDEELPLLTITPQRVWTFFGRERPPWDRVPPPPVRLVLRRASTVYVDDGGIPTTIYTTAPTVGEALRRHDIIVYLGDRVNPSLGSRVSAGLKVYIQRSRAVELMADGRSLRLRTRGSTVTDVLAQQSIMLVGEDFVEPAESTPVQEGMGIRVTRVARATAIEQESIPFETVWRPAQDIEIDQQRLEQDGKEGLTKRQIKVVYHDGQEVKRNLQDEWIENGPETKVIAYGTKIIPRELDTEAGPVTYWRKVRMLATSYTAATSGKARDHPKYGITFTGIPVKRGIVAVDPKVVSLRSQVYVPGYGLAVAGDTGGGIKGRRIDLAYEEDDVTLWYRWVDVFVLGLPPPQEQIRWVLPNWPRERR
jgi:uncharacterized protein YabE (DUF348 family)